jgi:hypothetical protein
MSQIKRIVAIVLILAMTLCVGLEAFAAGSPTVGPEFDPTTGIVTEESQGTTLQYDVDTKAITSIQSQGEAKTYTVDTVIDQTGQETQPTTFGDDAQGVFDSVQGRKITTVTFKHGTTLKSKSLKRSKVKKIVAEGPISIEKGAFLKTLEKKPKIYAKGIKKASEFKVEKGAFKGTTGGKIYVSKDMSKKEFKKLQKKLKKAGFKGKLVRSEEF